MKFEIKTNVDEFSLNIANKIEEIQQEELLEEIGFYMENEMRKRFDTGTDMNGNAWEKLKYRQGKPLRDTGALMGSLGEMKKIGSNRIAVFSNLKYARLHDQGGTIEPKEKNTLHFKIDGVDYFSKKITVPARKFSGISDKNKEEIQKIVSKYFEKKLK